MESKIPAKGIAQVSPSVEPSSPAEAKAAIGASVPPRASTRRITENIIKKNSQSTPTFFGLYPTGRSLSTVQSKKCALEESQARPPGREVIFTMRTSL
mgnify:CR=1 FL=1